MRMALKLASGLCAYDSAAGTLRWQVTIPGSSPALAAEAGGILYLDQGMALNTKTGRTIKVLWQNATATSLVIGNGRIAAVTDPRIVDLYGLPSQATRH